MGWDKGRYYTRSKKVNGCVVREYLGTGRNAELASQIDADNRRNREAMREILRAEQAGLDALDALLDELNDVADLLARAALMASGFHLHRRSEWRRRRVRREEPDCSKSGRHG